VVDIPQGFLESMQALLGDEYAAFARTFTGQPFTGIRINPLKLDDRDPPRVINQLSPNDKVTWCRTGWLLADSPSFGKHPYHAAGLYYMQEPSAMAVAEILDPQPGERVLDLCAAPGGKSTHLAALMGNQGVLVSNEIHPQRAWELAENLERWGGHNSVILNETPARLADHFGAFFDRVLVDAPCSGEGMFRKSASARQDWSPAFVQGCTARQADILCQAARLVRPGGSLVYSTCTFNPNENEDVIGDFLEADPANPQFQLLEIERKEGFSPGRPDWMKKPQPDLQHAVRIWPHLAPGEGHFIALLRRTSSSIQQTPLRWRPEGKARGEALRLFQDFHTATIQLGAFDLDSGLLLKTGSYLYLLLDSLPDLGNLKVIHPGWWLGTIKKNRFEPSHALALGLSVEAARLRLDLSANSPEIQAYLRGETLISPGEDGWLLVTVDNFPLGWGKRVQGMVKNYYPRGLRRFT
jgi:NOL1/NOP2/sun family putative RNA methylase